MTQKTSKSPRVASQRRLIVMLAIGLVVGLIVNFISSWGLAIAAGWASACLVYIVWVWSVIGRLDARETRAHATREDPGHGVSDALVLAASIAALAAVVLILVVARPEHGAPRALVAGLALSSVALSWVLVHTVYTLRYARMYYAHTTRRPIIDFNQEEPPRYSDFAYLAFTLGMTFQVSDTNVRASGLRGVVLFHTLLSYIFGSVILATVINLIAGLG